MFRSLSICPVLAVEMWGYYFFDMLGETLWKTMGEKWLSKLTWNTEFCLNILKHSTKNNFLINVLILL